MKIRQPIDLGGSVGDVKRAITKLSETRVVQQEDPRTLVVLNLNIRLGCGRAKFIGVGVANRAQTDEPNPCRGLRDAWTRAKRDIKRQLLVHPRAEDLVDQLIWDAFILEDLDLEPSELAGVGPGEEDYDLNDPAERLLQAIFGAGEHIKKAELPGGLPAHFIGDFIEED